MRGRETWEPSVASSESEVPFGFMRVEIMEGVAGEVYVSARVKSHIRIVASVEPVATMLSSIWRHRTDADN